MDDYHYEMIHAFPKNFLENLEILNRLFTLTRILNCSRELFIAPR
jgi:hypothetical protein